MSIETHIRRGHAITLGLLILFGIIELSLSAWLTARYSRDDDESVTARDRIHFTLFVSIWTVVFSSVFTVMFLHSPTGKILTSVLSHLIFLTLTWVFWTAAAAAVTELLGGGLNCNNPAGFTYCGQLNATEAFAWIEWILVTFALIVVLIRGITAARRGDGYRGSLIG